MPFGVGSGATLVAVVVAAVVAAVAAAAFPEGEVPIESLDRSTTTRGSVSWGGAGAEEMAAWAVAAEALEAPEASKGSEEGEEGAEGAEGEATTRREGEDAAGDMLRSGEVVVEVEEAGTSDGCGFAMPVGWADGLRRGEEKEEVEEGEVEEEEEEEVVVVVVPPAALEGGPASRGVPLRRAGISQS